MYSIKHPLEGFMGYRVYRVQGLGFRVSGLGLGLRV